jgi:hypothetical protein
MTSEDETKLITDEEKRMMICVVVGMVLMWAAGFVWGKIV